MGIRPSDDPMLLADGALPLGADELAARRALLVDAAAPAVLMLDGSEERLATVRAWARRRSGVRPLFAGTMAAALEVVEREPPEVAIIDLLFRGTRGIAVAGQIRLLAPDVEVVFVTADRCAPEVQAAFDLGWQRIVAASGLEGWLERAMLPLCRLASLRRQTTRAQLAAAELAAGDVVPGPSALPLGVAERRYRETFLRGKLAMAGGRREAARLAGVPYTTFCVMLRKLGIRG